MQVCVHMGAEVNLTLDVVDVPRRHPSCFLRYNFSLGSGADQLDNAGSIVIPGVQSLLPISEITGLCH